MPYKLAVFDVAVILCNVFREEGEERSRFSVRFCCIISVLSGFVVLVSIAYCLVLSVAAARLHVSQ